MQDLSQSGAPATAAYLTNGAVAALTAEVNIQAHATPLFFQPSANSTTAWQLRNAAGTVKFDFDSTNGRIGIGTAAPASVLHATIDDANASTVVDVLTLDHTASAAGPSVGIGAGILLRTADPAATPMNIAAMRASMTNVTGGSEASKVRIETRVGGGALGLSAEFARESGVGSVWRYESPGLRIRNETGDVEVAAISSGANGEVLFFNTGRLRTIQTASTSSTPNSVLHLTGGAHTTLTAAEAVDVNVDMSRTVQFTAGGTIATQRAMRFQAPTYSATAAQTITNATTLEITAPVAGTNVTLTNAFALNLVSDSGLHFALERLAATARKWSFSVRSAGQFAIRDETGASDVVTITHAASAQPRAIQMNNSGTAAAPTWSWAGDANTGFFNPGADLIGFTTGGVERARIDASGRLLVGSTTGSGHLYVVQPATASGTPVPALRVDGGAHTANTASTEMVDVNVNLARTVQWATGALATQRAFLVQAPTYAFVGASTITDAATLAVSGAPVAGTNATITNPYALWVQAGSSFFAGSILASAGTAALPACSFQGDPNTGLFNPTADVIGFATAGAEVARLDASGNFGVGVSPSNRIHAVVNDGSASSVTNVLRIDHTTTGAAAAGIGTGLLFATENSGGSVLSCTQVTGTFLTVTAGSEEGAVNLLARSGGSLIQRFRMSSSGIQVGATGGATGARLEVVQVVGTSGTPIPAQKITGAAHTTITAAEAVDVDFALNRTVQFTAGAAFTQRAVAIGNPTYSATAAQTITKATTLSIAGEPVAGTNVTMTNAFALDVSGRTLLFADKPTGSGSDYTANTFQTELGGGTQTAPMHAGLCLAKTLGSSVISGAGELSAFSCSAQHSSTGACGILAGTVSLAWVAGPGALGTVTTAIGFDAQVSFEDDGGLPTSGSITDAIGYRLLGPSNTSALRTITNMTGLQIQNLGATGVTNAVGIDVQAQSGASGLNLGIRTASTLQITGGGIDHDAGNVGFFAAAPVAQQASGANLTNNVAVGGTDDIIANYTDLATYANDAAAIRNDIYQLARKLKQVNDALRLYGLLT